MFAQADHYRFFGYIDRNAGAAGVFLRWNFDQTSPELDKFSLIACLLWVWRSQNNRFDCFDNKKLRQNHIFIKKICLLIYFIFSRAIFSVVLSHGTCLAYYRSYHFVKVLEDVTNCYKREKKPQFEKKVEAQVEKIYQVKLATIRVSF